jgi:hypothetical protein
MLELIKLLIEIASKLGDAIHSSRDRRFKRLGQSMFLIHFRITEVINTGDEIIGALERFQKCVQFRMTNWKEDLPRAASICSPKPDFYLFNEQYLNINRLYSAISNVQTEFKLLSPDVEANLTMLTGIKSCALDFITSSLRQGHILIDYPNEMAEFARAYQDFSPTPKAEEIFAQTKVHTLDVSHVNAKSFSHLLRYLNSKQPEKHIQSFQSVNKKLRLLIEKHWTIKEILPGMERLIRNSDAA